MAIQVKLDAFESTEPQPQWLNQLSVTTSVAKLFEQRGDMEKAANCYETVLFYNPKDTKTRVKLSKCYQKILKPELAVIHQNYAKQMDPLIFQTVENEVSVNFNTGNFENSLIGYSKYLIHRKTSVDCQRGLLKINEIMENTLPVEGIMCCLGATILNMLENEHNMFDELMSCKTLEKPNELKKLKISRKKRSQEAYYLHHVIESVHFYKKQLNDLPHHNTNDKLVYAKIQEIDQTFKKLKDDLYQQKPYYMVSCQRLKHQLHDKQKFKDMITLQVAKYINTIVKYCLVGEIGLAQRQADLALKYMDQQYYRPPEIVNTLYEVIGLATFLINQNVSEWSNEINDKRIMYILLGPVVDKNKVYNNIYHESYFGRCNYDTRESLKKLTKRLEETELSTYSLYLQHERIKCYLKLKWFKRSRPLTKQMFNDACTLGSIAWQVNALMMTVISESRMGNVMKCMKTLEFILTLSRILGNDNVTQFLRKIWKLFAENRIRANVMDRKEKRKSDLIDIMPDSETAFFMRNLLHSIEILPAEYQMSLFFTAPPENNCATTRRHDR